MGKERERGGIVDATKLKMYAEKVGITSVAQLDKALLLVYPNYDGARLAKKAWRGEVPIDRRFLEKIANVVQVSYEKFTQVGNVDSSWGNLISNEKYQEDFVSFVPYTETDLRLIQLENNNKNNLPEYSLRTKWHLEILGNQGEQVFILLQSESDFFQLAPVRKDGFSNILTSINTRYPSSSYINFDPSYGGGWRRLVVVKGRQLPILAKDDASKWSCSFDEIALFARQLLSRKDSHPSVYVLEFYLVSPPRLQAMG